MKSGDPISCLAIAAALVSAGCGSGLPMKLELTPTTDMCRTAEPAAARVRWMSPSDAEDRTRLRAWCAAVGPVVVHDPLTTPPVHPVGPLIVVSWNMAVGKGRVLSLLEELRREHPASEVILLLQEAYRSEAPPAVCPSESRRAKAIGHPRPPGSEDIVSLAIRTGMYCVYAPSMRNGRDCAAEPREDRGNAILSTLPISDVVVIELPFSQQRRVAVAARARVDGRDLGLVSTHFDTRHGHGAAATAIVQSLAVLGWQSNLVIAGDFNSFLPLDGGVRRMNEHFTELRCGRGPTHGNDARLDHIFIARDDAPSPCRTGAKRYGSDHNPLIAVISSGLAAEHAVE